MTSQADKLAGLLRRDEMIVAPGAYDCITARMVDLAGYAACYMTGAGVAATPRFSYSCTVRIVLSSLP